MDAIIDYVQGLIERGFAYPADGDVYFEVDKFEPYGQLSRRGAYEHLDIATTMRRLTDDIASGRFADEWDAESRAGHPRLSALREQFAGPAVAAFEQDLRRRLGPRARP